MPDYSPPTKEHTYIGGIARNKKKKNDRNARDCSSGKASELLASATIQENLKKEKIFAFVRH